MIEGRREGIQREPGVEGVREDLVAEDSAGPGLRSSSADVIMEFMVSQGVGVQAFDPVVMNDMAMFFMDGLGQPDSEGLSSGGATMALPVDCIGGSVVPVEVGEKED